MKTRNNKRKKNKSIKNNKSNKSSNLKKINCSPNPNSNGFSCYSNESLFKIKKLWNARHPRNKINSNEPKEIWDSIRTNLSNVCDRESCWIRSKFMEGNLDRDLLNYTFAPEAPDEWKRTPNEWLSSLDIESVMKKYERYYKKCIEEVYR